MRGQCLHEGEYNSQNIHNRNLANALWVMEQTLRQWLLERSMQQEHNFHPRHQALVHMCSRCARTCIYHSLVRIDSDE